MGTARHSCIRKSLLAQLERLGADADECENAVLRHPLMSLLAPRSGGFEQTNLLRHLPGQDPLAKSPGGVMALDIGGQIAMISLWTWGNQARSQGPLGRTKAQPKGLRFALQSTNRFVQPMVGRL
jgi:hypothetical protein